MIVLQLFLLLQFYQSIQQNTSDLNQCLCYKTHCSKSLIADIDCTDVFSDTCNYLIDTPLNPICKANCTCSINGQCRLASNTQCFFLYWKYVILVIAVFMMLFGLHMSLSLKKRFFDLYWEYDLKYFFDVKGLRNIETAVRNGWANFDDSKINNAEASLLLQNQNKKGNTNKQKNDSSFDFDDEPTEEQIDKVLNPLGLSFYKLGQKLFVYQDTLTPQRLHYNTSKNSIIKNLFQEISEIRNRVYMQFLYCILVHMLAIGNLFLVQFLLFFYQENLQMFVIFIIIIYSVFGAILGLYLFGYFGIKGYSHQLNLILDNFEIENKCKIQIQRKWLIMAINWMDHQNLYAIDSDGEQKIQIEKEKKKQDAFKNVKKDQIAPIFVQKNDQEIKNLPTKVQTQQDDNKGSNNTKGDIDIADKNTNKNKDKNEIQQQKSLKGDQKKNNKDDLQLQQQPSIKNQKSIDKKKASESIDKKPTMKKEKSLEKQTSIKKQKSLDKQQFIKKQKSLEKQASIKKEKSMEKDKIIKQMSIKKEKSLDKSKVNKITVDKQEANQIKKEKSIDIKDKLNKKEKSPEKEKSVKKQKSISKQTKKQSSDNLSISETQSMKSMKNQVSKSQSKEIQKKAEKKKTKKESTENQEQYDDVEKRFLDIPDDEDYMVAPNKIKPKFTDYQNPDSEFSKKKTLSQKKKK